MIPTEIASMHSSALVPYSPLGSLAGSERLLVGSEVVLKELPTLIITHLVCKGASKLALDAAGLADESIAQTGSRPHMFWLAPGEWLHVTDSPMAKAAFAVPGASFLQADLSHGRASLELSGSSASLVLAKGCGIDLHGAVFLDGHYAQTRLAQAAVLLHRCGTTFTIYCGAETASYLWQWLAAAMHEYLD